MGNQTTKWGHTIYDTVLTALRVALFPPGVSIGKISAGADCDLQTGRVCVIGQRKLQLSCHAGALKEATVCAVAAVAVLRR